MPGNRSFRPRDEEALVVPAMRLAHSAQLVERIADVSRSVQAARFATDDRLAGDKIDIHHIPPIVHDADAVDGGEAFPPPSPTGKRSRRAAR